MAAPASPPQTLVAEDTARRNDARIVEHQQVTGIDEIGKIGESPVAQFLLPWIEQQHARRHTLGQRRLRDKRFGQIIIEIAEQHRRGIIKNAVS